VRDYFPSGIFLQKVLGNTSKEKHIMSQSKTSTDFAGTRQASGAGTSEQSTSGNGATATATALAQEYGEKISDVASQAKDFVSEKMTVVGDKLKDLQNTDLSELTENAKDYARKNPGQTILISAAAGFLLGLILRGRR
jgi:ElaB/YqjD/DUF883 family membrane-anchored ribosome-binding protein